MHTVLRSATREVVIGDDQPFCIIGERINPTGARSSKSNCAQGDLSRIEIDVAQQVAGGAMVLDVNMGAPLADEAELMVQAVKLDPEPHRPAPVHRLLGRRGARRRAWPLTRARRWSTRSPPRTSALRPSSRSSRATAPRSSLLPNDEYEIPEEPERRLELARKIVDVATRRLRHRCRGHRPRPARHAHRRGHHPCRADARDDRR